jgi:hypothetical protein
MQDVKARFGKCDLHDLIDTLDAAPRSSYDCRMTSGPIRFALAAMPLLISAPSTAAEKRYAISDFDHVQVFGPFNVVIQTGRATSVTASGDVAALDVISVNSSSGVLTVKTLTKARSSWKDQPHKAAKIVIILPKLAGLRLLGGGSIIAAEMRGITTNITLNGSGQISVTKLASDNATVRLNGAGRITVSGTAKNLDAIVNGSGDLDATQLMASDLKIASSTSGRITARALRTADVKQNGAGEVRIIGKPSCLVENLGAGSASCGD